MDNKFDQSIFGQLILPQPISNKEKITSNLNKNSDNRTLTTMSFQQKNIQLERNKNLMLNIKGQSQIVKDCYGQEKKIQKLTQKQYSNKSTKGNSDGSQSQKNFIINIKNLSKNDEFQCIKCRKQKETQKCKLCQGKGKISGNDNIIKFIQYIMQFKMRQRQSYKLKDYKLSSQSNQKKCLSLSGGQKNPLSKTKACMSLKEYQQQKAFNFKQRQRHTGYKCDKCQVTPISGRRFHCADPSCKNDYDLCQGCLFEHGHEHQMQQITDNGFHQYFSAFVNSLFNHDEQKSKF